MNHLRVDTAGTAPADLRLPHSEPGMRIGLFGGSFNPAHEGHLLVAETALRRLELDRIWWMVSPGNPLKDNRNLRSLAARIETSRRIAADPRITVTAFEASYEIRYSANTVRLLRRRRPRVRFVWIMGADSLAGFHRWQDWRAIAEAMPIAVVDRPGATLSPVSARAAQALARFRRPEILASRLARMTPPAWIFLHGPRSPVSSSLIRASIPDLKQGSPLATFS